MTSLDCLHIENATFGSQLQKVRRPTIDRFTDLGQAHRRKLLGRTCGWMQVGCTAAAAVALLPVSRCTAELR